MQYRSVKVGHRIIFIPDFELKRALRSKLRSFEKDKLLPDLPISSYGKQGGLRRLLYRHRGGRFFVVVDFVHAFHQVTREMISQAFPKIMDARFDVCFIHLGGKEVIPIGFPTSSYLFELFLARRFDGQLKEWQDKYQGMVTRYTDNVLMTWKKNTKEAFEELEKIFTGVSVRITPKNPRKWEEPIRFCGVIIPCKGQPRISQKRRKEIIHKALQKPVKSLSGAQRFLDQWDPKKPVLWS